MPLFKDIGNYSMAKIQWLPISQSKRQSPCQMMPSTSLTIHLRTAEVLFTTLPSIAEHLHVPTAPPTLTPTLLQTFAPELPYGSFLPAVIQIPLSQGGPFSSLYTQGQLPQHPPPTPPPASLPFSPLTYSLHV